METLAEIRMFAGNFAPRGWAFCEGQILPINSYQALFSLLGTTYGGDGRTTFALPEFRGRVVLGIGNGPGLSSHNQGQRSGLETTILNDNTMPAHSHNGSFGGTAPRMAVGANADGGDDPSDQWLGETGNDIYSSTVTTGEYLGALDNKLTVAVANTGASSPYDNMQPWLAVNFIIALTGVFPSRS